MSTVTAKAPPAATSRPPEPPIPPLENGDRLTREEFERRCDAMPNLKKAELIEGVVYMPPNVRFEHHSAPHFDVIGWLSLYRMATPGIRGGDNGSIRLDLDNMPQPDAFLVVLPSHGGRVKIDEDDYIAGAPELIAEVASSSASYDLHDKRNVYRRNGVQEYLVWRIQDRELDWFALRGGTYDRLAPGADGILRSAVFPGLWLDPAALVRGDMATVARVAQQGLASPEHAAFAARLEERAAALAPRPPKAD